MAHKKRIATTLMGVLAAFIFTAEPGFANSSYRQYLQYRDSDTYKMVHGEENKDPESVQKEDRSKSPDEEDTTDDYNSGDTDSFQPENQSNETESYLEDKGWGYLSPLDSRT